MDDYIVLSTPANERKRQEIIFELVYTEENFLKDLEYVIKVHTQTKRRKMYIFCSYVWAISIDVD